MKQKLSTTFVPVTPDSTSCKCARCHQVYSPSDYTESKWNVWMSRMSKKAHLDADREQLLSQFAAAIRKSAESVEARRSDKMIR